MSNVKKISFKGYQNVGYTSFTENLSKPGLTSSGFRIVVELTDELTPDLSLWKPILEKFPNKDGSNFVKIDCAQNVGSKKRIPYISLNGRRVGVIEDNMPVFVKMANLLKNIRETALKYKEEHPSPFKITENYTKTINLLRSHIKNQEEAKDVDIIGDVSWLINNEISIEINELLSKGRLKPLTSYKEIVPGREKE